MRPLFPLLLAVALFTAGFGFPAQASGQHSPDAPSASSDSMHSATQSPGGYKIYTSDGAPAGLADVVLAAEEADVVFIGEVHDDAIAHALQDSIWQRLVERSEGRDVALSLEMFERDVQPVLDEYLSGAITEKHFVEDVRAWQSYRTAYRPLVETAKQNNVPVLAANAPRRYVNRVARTGRDGLSGLSAWAKQWVAPLPFPGPSEAYREKWDRLMRSAMPPGHGATRDESVDGDAADPGDPPVASSQEPVSHGGLHHASGDEAASPMLLAQSLWDATMAYTIADHLTRYPGHRVLHVTGAFHVSQGTGTPEALQHYRPGTRALIVLIRPVADPHAFDEDAHTGLGDFVILTEEG